MRWRLNPPSYFRRARLGRFLAAVVLLCSAVPAGAETMAHLAVIVNRQNTVEELSFEELVKIFKQEKQYWENGKRIYLLMRESGSAERMIMVEKVFQMKDDWELKNFWITKQFRGELFVMPKVLTSNEQIRALVGQVPNAVGYIEASAVNASVKVLRINGRLPGEPGYLLAE